MTLPIAALKSFLIFYHSNFPWSIFESVEYTNLNLVSHSTTRGFLKACTKNQYSVTQESLLRLKQNLGTESEARELKPTFNYI